MSLLLSAVAANIVSLSIGSAEASDFSSPNTAQLSFESNGTITGLTTFTSDKWYLLAPITAIGNDYEIFATRTAGVLPSGTLDTWIPLSSAVSWSLTQTGIGEKMSTLTIKIRTLGGAVLAEGSYVIIAEVL